MAKEQNPKPDNKEQSQRFVETAHQLEVDESGESFEKALNLINSSQSNASTVSDKEDI